MVEDNKKTDEESNEYKEAEENRKELFDYKLGEICNKDLWNGLMKAPVKLVAIGYTFQNDEMQMEIKQKTNDFREDKEDGEEVDKG